MLKMRECVEPSINWYSDPEKFSSLNIVTKRADIEIGVRKKDSCKSEEASLKRPTHSHGPRVATPNTRIAYGTVDDLKNILDLR